MIDLKFSSVVGESSPGIPVDFISKVTEQIAFKRAVCKDVRVSWAVLPVGEDDDSEDEDDYDDFAENAEIEDGHEGEGGENNEDGEQGKN